MSNERVVYTLRDGQSRLESHPLTAFQSEAEFQRLIAMDPTMNPGHLVDPEAPRRWMLVRREAGVGDEPGAAQWAIDHLLLDQDGIPTIVEVKRAENTEIRRQVIGQIVEYAAAAAASWRTFVPSVYGHAPKRATSAGSRGERWTEERFLEHAREQLSGEAYEAAAQCLEWAKTSCDEIYWGTGSTRGSFTPWVAGPGGRQPLFSVYSMGAFEVTAMWWKAPPYKEPEARRAVLEGLRQAGLQTLPIDAFNRRPSVRLDDLAAPGVLPQVLSRFADMAAAVRGSQAVS